MGSLVIALRNLRVTPVGMIVKVQMPSFRLVTEKGAFQEFVRMARETLPLEHSNVDVYIGWWGQQATIEIPREFFQLIAETGWPVTFDIND